ncbi:MAG: ATP-binding protein [Planctomycetota bacterium]
MDHTPTDVAGSDLAEAPQGAVPSLTDAGLSTSRTASSGVGSMFDAVILLDEQDRVVRINPAAEELCELRPLASHGHRLDECGEGAVVRAVLGSFPMATPDRQGQRTIEVADLLGMGSRVLRLTLAPMRLPNGSSAGTKLTLRDVTSEHRADELRNRYLSIVAHELRTPLTGIKTFVTLLVKRALGPLSEPQGEVLGSVREQVLRLEHQIDKLVHLGTLDARDATTDVSQFELPAMVSMVVAAFQAIAMERRVAFDVDPTPGPLLVRADRAQIRRALGALVENAVKFSRDGGVVTLRTTPVEGGLVEISVCDQGIGIDPRYHARIFERFFQVEDPLTRHHGGSGLGLFFVRQIVESHGSVVSVDSEVGRGARFSFRLPIADTPESSRIAVAVDSMQTGIGRDRETDRGVRRGSD